VDSNSTQLRAQIENSRAILHDHRRTNVFYDDSLPLCDGYHGVQQPIPIPAFARRDHKPYLACLPGRTQQEKTPCQEISQRLIPEKGNPRGSRYNFHAESFVYSGGFAAPK